MKKPTKHEVLYALVDMWYQYAYESGVDILYAGGNSSLEATESILRREGLLNRNGKVKKQFRKIFDC